MVLISFFRGGSRAGDSSTDAKGEPDVAEGDGKNLPIVDCLFSRVGNRFLGTHGGSTDGPDVNDSEEAAFLIGTRAKHSADAGFSS